MGWASGISFFFQAEDGIRATSLTGVQTCALPISLAGLVDIGYVKATGNSVKIYLPKSALMPEKQFEWKIPPWSNAIERDRARTYFQAYCAAEIGRASCREGVDDSEDAAARGATQD